MLEIGRQTRPKIYDLKADHPAPLVPRERRFEVAERVGPAGEVIRPLDRRRLQRAIGRGEGERGGERGGVLPVLVPQSRARASRVEALRAALPGLDVSLSCEVQPEFREYERLSTTVLNAFLQPVAGRYMARLGAAVESTRQGGHRHLPILGRPHVRRPRAAEMPIRTALSGPAAGVVGAVAAGARSGRRDLITFDMGGTSTDVCLVRDGKAEMAFGRSVAGFPVRLPSIDIHTVGAGGGSDRPYRPRRPNARRTHEHRRRPRPGLLWQGRPGADRLGCQSRARAPARGAHRRRHAPRSAPGQAEPSRRWRQKLGSSLRETALGIVRIVNANMMRAIRVVSIERGHDPRTFTLMPFGGAGALHAVEIARELGIRSILVPPAPGILCAEGVAAADMEESFVASCRVPLDGDLAPVRRRPLPG